MVENGKFLKRLRNVHLEKSLLPQAFFRASRSPMTAKAPLKVHLRLRFQNPGKPRTAGFVVGRTRLRLRPFILCFYRTAIAVQKSGLKVQLFAQNSSRRYRQKLPSQRCSQPFLIAFFNFSHKRPTFAFTSESVYTLGSLRKIAHKGLHAETRGVSDGTAITTPRSVPHVHKHPRAGCQNGELCRFKVLAGVLLKNF